MAVYKNLKPETDTGPRGGERRTPIGRIWAMDAHQRPEDGLINISCLDTGASIRVTPEELSAEFRAYGCKGCGSHCAVPEPDDCRICNGTVVCHICLEAGVTL